MSESRDAWIPDLRPLLFLAVLYGVVQWLPFEIFGWLQNEDGLMEYASVILLAAAGVHAWLLARSPRRGVPWRLAWCAVLLCCLIFVGEEISWGERLHGLGLEAIRSINTQHETTLHNISVIQERGLLHRGWILLGLGLGGLGWILPQASLVPERRLCLYVLLPALWYGLYDACAEPGECLVTVANHQEVYELLVAAGLFLHCRGNWRRLGRPARGGGA